MKNSKFHTLTVLLMGVFACLSASAVQASEALAKKHGCTGCHAMSEKIVGPSFLDVGKKYATEKDARTVISQSIQKGGVGKWGKIPMPPNDSLTDADAKALALWILATPK